jgi:ABC-type nitrate/sulfonate/bicarbonate transport system substrate-binding protein
LKWISDNPDDAQRMISERLNFSPEVSQQMSMPRYPLDGRNDPALLESMQSVLVEAGLLQAPIPLNQLYDETLLDEVLSERR